MFRFNIFFIFHLLWLVVFSCKSEKKDIPITSDFDYIQQIEVQEDEDVLSIQYKTLDQKFSISKEDLPFTSCMVLCASPIGYLDALDALEMVTEVGTPLEIYHPKILQKVERKELPVVVNQEYWDIEAILQSPTQLIFTIYNPSFEKYYTICRNAGKTLVFMEEYTEAHPLARTEYITVLGKLLGKEEAAVQTFKTIQTHYLSLKKQTLNLPHKPTVLAKIMYGDIWYMPAGESYAATLYADAGGNYLWKDTQGNGSLQLTFEEVYQKAKEAEYWLDVSDQKEKSVLLAQNTFYQEFTAYQKNALYGTAKRKNIHGANDYYESGVVYCDSILMDLVSILHPDLLPNHQLMYYQQLGF